MVGIVRKGYVSTIVVLALLLPAIAFADQISSREYPYLYKSPRAMGMGGAYTAVGGRVDSLFYNPAGLINIPQDKGWEVDLINVTVEYGKKTKEFLTDMNDAMDTSDLNNDGNSSDDQLRAVNDVLANYRGQNLHGRVADFTAVGKSYDSWAFGVGAIGSGRIDAMTHQGFGSDGLLEVSADAIYGAVAGASLKVKDNVYVGLGLKSLHRESLIHTFTARELIEQQDSLSDYIKDQLRVNGDAIGADAGLIWKFAPDSWFKPSVGASVMNVGGLHFGEAGTIPQTVNMGMAVNPDLSPMRSLTVAVDYVDVLNNFKEDKDMAKRLRYGVELQLFDLWFSELALRAGMYENSPTLGCDLRLLFITVSYAMYTEEIGAYAGQDKDKRQLLTLNLGW